MFVCLGARCMYIKCAITAHQEHQEMAHLFIAPNECEEWKREMLKTNWIKNVIRFNCVLLGFRWHFFFFSSLVCTLYNVHIWPLAIGQCQVCYWMVTANGIWITLSILFGWSDASCYHVRCIQFIQTNRHSTNKVTHFFTLQWDMAILGNRDRH